jgi:alpha-ketoglutarate-dependent taurine dioxygenase
MTQSTSPLYETITLNDQEASLFFEKFLSIHNPIDDFFNFFLGATEGLNHLNDQTLSSFSNLLERKGKPVILLTGLPADTELPPTPANARFPKDKRTFVTEACMVLFAGLIGIPVAYAKEKDGEIIQSLCPVQSNVNIASSEGAADLKLHTDNAFHLYNPDFLMLCCLRSDRQDKAATLLVDVQSAFSSLSEEHQSVLQDPLFVIHAPPSFEITEASQPCPLITFDSAGVIQAHSSTP